MEQDKAGTRSGRINPWMAVTPRMRPAAKRDSYKTLKPQIYG